MAHRIVVKRQSRSDVVLGITRLRVYEPHASAPSAWWCDERESAKMFPTLRVYASGGRERLYRLREVLCTHERSEWRATLEESN